jgi:hypothetical protein
MTNGGDNQLVGVRLLHAMLRKCPELYYSIIDDDTPVSSRRDDTITLDAILLNKSTKCCEIGARICAFITDLIAMMANGDLEKTIVDRIRHVGYMHYERGICLNSAVWREFKSSTLAIVAECEYAAESERTATLAAWNTFVSVIIREMKMGIWCRNGDGDTFAETTSNAVGSSGATT